MELANKVMVVTGGGNGIGREIVLQLVQRGARVAVVDVRQDSLDETKRLAAAGDRVSTHVVDITDRPRVLALVAQVLEAHGAVDGLINNAGIIQPFVRIADLDFEAIDRVVNVNFYGTVNMIKAFLPELLKRPEGHIVNVSSMGGFLPVPGQGIYGATKAAVKLLGEALFAELRGTGVGVTVVMPGATSTDITKNSGVTTPGDDAASSQSAAMMTSPQVVAGRILDGIEQKRLHVFPAKDSRLMDIAMRLAPKGAILLIERQMRSLLAGY